MGNPPAGPDRAKQKLINTSVVNENLRFLTLGDTTHRIRFEMTHQMLQHLLPGTQH